MTPDWQDIKTAPKDQTDILVLHGGKYMSVVWWDEVFGGWLVAALEKESIYVIATHWRPLPDLPNKHQRPAKRRSKACINGRKTVKSFQQGRV